MAIVEQTAPATAAPAPTAAARRRPGWTDLVAVVAILVGLGALWSVFGSLFPQVEFVDWIVPRSSLGTEIGQRLSDVFSFDHVYHTRTLSLLWSISTGHACGTDITCINAFAFVPVGLTALGLFLAGRVLGLPALAALAVVAVFLASQPTFEVLSWQATMHDRLAGATTMVCVIVFYLAAHHVRRTWTSLVPWTIGLAVLGLVTLHTKESAWAVIALAISAPLLVARGRQQRRTVALVFALPVALMLADAVTQYLVVQDDPHINSGPVAANLRFFATVVVPGGLAVAVVLLVIALAAVAFVVLRRRAAPAAFALLPIAGWIALAAACGWVIPARTAYQSAFYMFVPIATIALAVALVLRAAFLALPARERSGYRYAAAVIGVGLTAWFVVGSLTNRYDQYHEVAKTNDTFRQGLARIASIRAQHPKDQIQFTYPAEVTYGYRFVTASPATDFFRLANVQRPIDETYAAGTSPPPCGTKGVVTVQLDRQLRPVRTC